jgi:hypothetical protein
MLPLSPPGGQGSTEGSTTTSPRDLFSVTSPDSANGQHKLMEHGHEFAQSNEFRGSFRLPQPTWAPD